MNALRKLNVGYLQGSFIIAGALGWITSSFLFFVVAFAILITGNLIGGDIRLKRRGR